MTKDMFVDKLQTSLFQVAGKDIKSASNHELYLSLGITLRDIIGKNWSNQNNLYKEKNVKEVYYLSIEYLTGTFTKKNLQYLGLFEVARNAFNELGRSIEDVLSEEDDPGLGNGGLGRLAVAFLDSLSSLGMFGHGYGLRYKHGLFEQNIKEGRQVEQADNWLSKVNIWEYKRDESYEIKLGGNVNISGSGENLVFSHVNYEQIKAVPYDIPYLGYKNDSVNTLRLWSAEAINQVNFEQFSNGHFQESVREKNQAQAITQFLYPNDSNIEGKKLRLKQEYFLVSASIQDLIKKFIDKGLFIKDFPKYRAIQLNDTHPVLAIPEFMRILMDEYKLEWVEAWDVTVRTFAFTNHTILPEAMERWDIGMVKEIIPRIWLIIEELNHRFIYILKNEKNIEEYAEIRDLSLIENNEIKMVNLAIIGSHSINGVAEMHTNILKEKVFNNFYKIFPERFNNKTNGIVHRRWLFNANPSLTEYLKKQIGDFTDPNDLIKLLEFKDDKKVLDNLMRIKHENKVRLAEYIFQTQGLVVNPYSIFDVHIKRIHEYKRQLLNILHIIYLYNKLKENPNLDIVPRTFIFSGKAANGYYAAKEIIRLILSVSDAINNDISIKDKLKVVFIENYNVTKAELIIPAADISEQISTTTKEASGTGNMKLMMNGAITLATRDGANVEIGNQVGEDNIVFFGLKDYEVYGYLEENNYNSKEIYHMDKKLKSTIDKLISRDSITGFEEYRLLYDLLIKYNDMYFILKDFDDYRLAQEKINDLYRDRNKWSKMSLINIAHSGVFSSDNTIKKYAEEIWGIK